MDTLLARYLDGELTEHEARVFQTELEANRALAARLREIEASLELLAGARFHGPDADFKARVLDALPKGTAAQPERGRGSWRAWALAASVVLCFGIGWTAGRMAPGVVTGDGSALVAEAPRGETAPVRWVRLVLVPDAPDVRQVAVAGDFNGWDDAASPMVKQGEVWVAWLRLPADVYEYQFVINGGERWIVDPLAARTREDGFGGENAVLDLSL